MLGTPEGTEEFRKKYIDGWRTHEEYLTLIGEEMKANTAWDLKVSPQVKVTPEPTAEELTVPHAVDVMNVLKRK